VSQIGRWEKKGKAGVLKSQPSRREFLADTRHRLRFVYLPKHSSWLNQIEVIFGIVNRKVIRRGTFTSLADLEEKLRAFLEYYNHLYAHPFTWTYTGKPLDKNRSAKFCPPHRHPRSPSKVTLANIALRCAIK
jgi:hypothetical protein